MRGRKTAHQTAAVDHTKVLSQISISLRDNLADLEQLRRARPMMDIMAIHANDPDSQRH
jgi:mannitol/fructose-specific phosphotransferase system IIA component (Ntr-type)